MFDMQYSGKAIAKARKAKNMTQMALADAMSISYQAVSNWERGVSMPDISKLPELSELLGISVDEILGKKSFVIDGVLINGDFNDATAEELVEAVPLLKPSQIEKVVDEIGEKIEKVVDEMGKKIEWTEILPMIEYLSGEFCAELFVRAAEEKNWGVVAALAEYACEDTVNTYVKKIYSQEGLKAILEFMDFIDDDYRDELFREAVKNRNPHDIEALAEYAYEDSVDEAGRELYREGGVREILSFIDFMSENAVQEIAEDEYRKNGVNGLTVLAGYLPEDYLNQCAADAFAKGGFKAIELIAEYVDNKILEKYIREKYL